MSKAASLRVIEVENKRKVKVGRFYRRFLW